MYLFSDSLCKTLDAQWPNKKNERIRCNAQNVCVNQQLTNETNSSCRHSWNESTSSHVCSYWLFYCLVADLRIHFVHYTEFFLNFYSTFIIVKSKETAEKTRCIKFVWVFALQNAHYHSIWKLEKTSCRYEGRNASEYIEFTVWINGFSITID